MLKILGETGGLVLVCQNRRQYLARRIIDVDLSHNSLKQSDELNILDCGYSCNIAGVTNDDTL